jgi:branched-chain amino acid transport system ATP-binding protein
MATLLRVDGVEAGYGDLVAVRAVSLEIGAGDLVGLIGSNGAGKTTTLRAISGLLPTRRGTITLNGARIDGLAPAAIVARGIAHVPEGRQLFPTMTVLENLELGARTPESRRHRPDTLAQIFDLFPRLAERRRQLAGTLSGGEQQMTAIGRALMARPRLLMLDEPSLGLAPVAVESIFENLIRINREGMTVLLVEQNVLGALRLSQRAYVLENGAIVLEGPCHRLLADEAVKRAYLGA